MNIPIQATLSELVRMNVDKSLTEIPQNLDVNLNDLTSTERLSLAALLADFSDKIPIMKCWDAVKNDVSVSVLKGFLANYRFAR